MGQRESLKSPQLSSQVKTVTMPVMGWSEAAKLQKPGAGTRERGTGRGSSLPPNSKLGRKKLVWTLLRVQLRIPPHATSLQ